MLDDLLILRPRIRPRRPRRPDLSRRKGQGGENETKVEELLGAAAGFEPLLVDEIDA